MVTKRAESSSFYFHGVGIKPMCTVIFLTKGGHRLSMRQPRPFLKSLAYMLAFEQAATLVHQWSPWSRTALQQQTSSVWTGNWSAPAALLFFLLPEWQASVWEESRGRKRLKKESEWVNGLFVCFFNVLSLCVTRERDKDVMDNVPSELWLTTLGITDKRKKQMKIH